MRFQGVSLIGDGRKGVVIDYEEVKSLTQFGANDNVKRTCRTPISAKMRDEIKRLKYYMLVAMGYWEPEWTKFLSDNKLNINKGKINTEEFEARAEAERLFSNTTVAGIRIRPKGITISGTVVINDKTITPKYDPINPDDEYGIYDELIDQVEELASAVFDYMDVERFNIRDSKQILETMTKTEEDKNKIKELSDEEAFDEIISFLQENGHVVISPDENHAVTEQKAEEVKVEEVKPDEPGGNKALEKEVEKVLKTEEPKASKSKDKKQEKPSGKKKEAVTAEDDW